MLKHLYLILVSTLVVGFLSGVYVYFLTKPPIEPPDPDEIPARGFEITAEVYGGCSRVGCPSYQVRSTGDYTYLPQTGSEVRYEGSLERSRRQELGDLLEVTDLQAVEDSEFSGTCPITYDAPAYTFVIRFEGTNYDIDTCVNDTEGEIAVLRLIELFEVFRSAHEE